MSRAMQGEGERFYDLLLSYCVGKPGSVGLRRRHEVVFKAHGRTFAFMNSPERPAVTVKSGQAERKALTAQAPVSRARWIGWFGWITVSVTDDATLRLALNLIDRSHELAT